MMPGAVFVVKMQLSMYAAPAMRDTGDPEKLVKVTSVAFKKPATPTPP
jgi:hypothetical protein